MALVGYARVSSPDQDLAVQIDQLKQAGCTKLFAEKKSGVTLKERSELESCLRYVREGDTLVFTRIDRLARSVMDFNKTVTELQSRGVELRCLLQPFDTGSPSGRLMIQVLAAFAEFEHAVRKERQAEGIAKAKERGVYGRPPKSGHTRNAWRLAAAALRDGLSTDDAAVISGIPARTVRDHYPKERIAALRLAAVYGKGGTGGRRPKLKPIYRADPPAHPPSAAEAVETEVTAEEPSRKAGIFGRLLGGR